MSKEYVAGGSLMAAEKARQKAFAYFFDICDSRNEEFVQRHRDKWYNATDIAYQRALSHRRWILSNKEFLGDGYEAKLRDIEKKARIYANDLDDISSMGHEKLMDTLGGEDAV